MTPDAKSNIEQCERFAKLFTDTERAIKRLLPINERKGDFQDLALRYAQLRPGLVELSDARMLKSVFELLKRERDLIAHTGWTHPAMVPSAEVLSTLEALHSAITHPITAYEAFVSGKAPVVSVQPDWDLARVLRIVDEHQFSQFPIIDRDNFKGIVTEQSIARFIAKGASKAITTVELTQITVGEIHDHENGRETYKFVGKETPIDTIEREFRVAVELEVVFVTESGAPSASIVGIATTWDIARLNKRRAT